MSLYPHLQLHIGEPGAGFRVTTVPPDFLQEYTYKSTFGSLYYVDFKVVDPNFGDLEKQLILADTGQLPIYSRFGYLDNAAQITGSWLKTRLINLAPRLSQSGMELTVNTQCFINGGNVETHFKTFEGKISDVVRQVADDMGVDAVIEETDDDENLSLPIERGGPGPRQWGMANVTYLDFLRYLASRARSKSTRSDYQVRFEGSKGFRAVGAFRKPTLHFHTPDFQSGLKAVKEFTYLLGKSDQVLEFTPNYDGRLLGTIGAAGLVAREFDPVTKQFKQKEHNSRTNNDESRDRSELRGRDVNAAPLNEMPEDLPRQKSGGVIVVRGNTPQEAEAKARATWSVLWRSTQTAQLVLAGVPDYSDIDANDEVQVNVLIPNSGAGPAYRKHWSSGRYFITEAEHQVASSYMITCQLQREPKGVLDSGILEEYLRG